jgi:hypothetical protein
VRVSGPPAVRAVCWVLMRRRVLSLGIGGRCAGQPPSLPLLRPLTKTVGCGRLPP